MMFGKSKIEKSALNAIDEHVNALRSVIGIKKFAWVPVELFTGQYIFLQHYYSHFPITQTYRGFGACKFFTKSIFDDSLRSEAKNYKEYNVNNGKFVGEITYLKAPSVEDVVNLADRLENGYNQKIIDDFLKKVKEDITAIVVKSADFTISSYSMGNFKSIGSKRSSNSITVHGSNTGNITSINIKN
jgi:hypothetical protein